MAAIFGVDIASLVLASMGGQLHVVTLHKTTVAIDAYGDPVRTAVDHIGQGVRLRWKTETAAARGYPMDAVKILMLQSDIPEPTPADEVTVGGDRWRVIDVMRDPVDATWVVAGVRA